MVTRMWVGQNESIEYGGWLVFKILTERTPAVDFLLKSCTLGQVGTVLLPVKDSQFLLVSLFQQSINGYDLVISYGVLFILYFIFIFFLSFFLPRQLPLTFITGQRLTITIELSVVRFDYTVLSLRGKILSINLTVNNTMRALLWHTFHHMVVVLHISLQSMPITT